MTAEDTIHDEAVTPETPAPPEAAPPPEVPPPPAAAPAAAIPAPPIAPAPIAPPAAVPQAPPVVHYDQRPAEIKSPMLAAFLSAVPGLGNIYNGLYGRGVSFFLIFVALIRIAAGIRRDEEIAIIVPSMIFFWLFNVFDAYRQATMINLGYSSSEDRQVLSAGGGLLVPGILLAVIGLVGALDRYFDIYVWDVLDHWPLIAVAFGGWLIWRAMRQRAET